jgi:hypothetical protein
MFGVQMVGEDVMYSWGPISYSPWLFMLGFAYLHLVSSWICPPAVFESPAFSTLVRLLMDLGFYSPLLVPLRHRGCLLWSRIESLLLSDTSSWVYMPRVLDFHFSKSFMFYMEVPNWCFIACFD